MTIVHIERPADLGSSAFEVFIPPPVGDLPRPPLGSVEAWAAPDGAVETGTWEATPGIFARAIIDAEFCHFVRGRVTFVTESDRVRPDVITPLISSGSREIGLRISTQL